MDFVVAGIGLGAAIILLGYVIHDLGPLCRRPRLAVPVASHQLDWKGLCQEIGTSLIGGGLALCGVTLAPLLLGASDAAGARIVLATSVLLLAVIGVRTIQSVRRYRPAASDVSAWMPAPPQPVLQRQRDPAASWPAPPKLPSAQPEPSSQKWQASQQETRESSEPADSAPTPGRFSSPLLRDIAPDLDAGGGFRSEILADVAPAEREPEPLAGFRSPLLAAMVTNDSAAGDLSAAAVPQDEAAVREASQNQSGSPVEAPETDGDQRDDPDAQPEADASVATTVPLDR